MAPRGLLALLAVLTGCTADLGVSRQPIVGGDLDTGDPAIVLFLAQEPTTQLASICTATLISPHVVLTAAHCVIPDAVGANTQFTVFTGTDVDTGRPSEFVSVKSTHAHPDFSLRDVLSGGDIAVGILANALSPTPIPMNRAPITDAFPGQPVRMVGYGKTSASDPTGATAGTKRQASTPLISYTDKLLHVGTAGDTTCEGDSGGPGLMTIGGVEAIVGVVSFGDPDCSMLAVDTRVDVYADDWVWPYVDDADPGFLSPPPGGRGGCAVASPGGPRAAWLGLLIVFVLLARQAPRRRQRLR